MATAVPAPLGTRLPPSRPVARPPELPRGGHPMSAPYLPSAATGTAIHNPAHDLPGDYNAAAAFLDRAAAQGWSERTALLTAEGQRWTYAQVAAGANRAGNALRALGVEMEQRVALLLYDSP